MNTVSVKDGSYVQAETLLLYRDRLKKDCRWIMTQYMQVFGALTVQVFQARISCIRKKKMIRYIQTSVNMGREANLKELTRILHTELETYEKKLEKLKAEYQSCREQPDVSEQAIRQADWMYRELAHILHPDLHPVTGTDPVLLDLWRRAEAAYDANDAEKLKELKELAAGRMAYLDQEPSVSSGVSAPGDMNPSAPARQKYPTAPAQQKYSAAPVQQKLKQQMHALESEIQKILTSEPYIYQSLLSDEVLTEKKLAELREELVSCRLYQAELDAQLAELAKQ